MLKKSNPLADIVKQGNLKIIKQLINSGYTVKDFSGSPVFNSINLGFIPIVKFFLDNGATVNKKDALRAAIFSGNLNMFKLILSRLGSFDTKFGERLLIMAVCNHHLNLVKYLVKQKVDLFNNNESALHCSVYCGNLLITKYLVNKGLNLARLSYKSFKVSVKKKRDDISFYIITEAIKKQQNKKLLNKFLKVSAEKGNIEIVKMLIGKGANIYFAKKYGSRVIVNHFTELFFNELSEKLQVKTENKLIKL